MYAGLVHVSFHHFMALTVVMIQHPKEKFEVEFHIYYPAHNPGEFGPGTTNPTIVRREWTIRPS
jgi:hypothetical protein